MRKPRVVVSLDYDGCGDALDRYENHEMGETVVPLHKLRVYEFSDVQKMKIWEMLCLIYSIGGKVPDVVCSGSARLWGQTSSQQQDGKDHVEIMRRGLQQIFQGRDLLDMDMLSYPNYPEGKLIYPDSPTHTGWKANMLKTQIAYQHDRTTTPLVFIFFDDIYAEKIARAIHKAGRDPFAILPPSRRVTLHLVRYFSYKGKQTLNRTPQLVCPNIYYHSNYGPGV